MDLLYTLQCFRESAPSWINRFLVVFSEGGLLFVPLVAACLFWAADKKKGRYIIAVFALSFLANGILKLIFCIYRPWVLDSRLYCAPEAVEEATGYSFPSAHCTMSAAILTAIACSFREAKWTRILAAAVTLFMMFARMYLGCHTLLDVSVGAGLGVLFALLLLPMLKLPYESVGTGRITLAFLFVLAAGSALFTVFKSYPMDLAADGTLLVDPKLMMVDTFAAIGVLTGAAAGNLLEIRYISFENADTVKKRWLRCVIGGLVFALLYLVILKKLLAPLNPNLGKMLRYLGVILWVAAGFPAVIKAAEGRL